jgi:sarcosine oxidase delta subunit
LILLKARLTAALLEGLAKTVPQLHTDHIEEYYALTDEEKGALVERFRDIKSRNFSLRRDTPRAKIQDVANIVRNMKMLVGFDS